MLLRNHVDENSVKCIFPSLHVMIPEHKNNCCEGYSPRCHSTQLLQLWISASWSCLIGVHNPIFKPNGGHSTCNLFSLAQLGTAILNHAKCCIIQDGGAQISQDFMWPKTAAPGEPIGGALGHPVGSLWVCHGTLRHCSSSLGTTGLSSVGPRLCSALKI